MNKMDKFALEQVITANHKVDREQLQEALATLEQLEAQGVPDAKYNIAPPFATRGGRRETAEARSSDTVIVGW